MDEVKEMKITKSKLKQIIKEELEAIQEETPEQLADELKREAPKLTRLGPGTARALKKTKELLTRVYEMNQSIHADRGLRAIEQVPEDYLKDRKEPGYKPGLNRFLHDEKPELMQTVHGAVLSTIMDLQP